MIHSSEGAQQAAQLVELKRLIRSRNYESVEMLEDAVDAFLWGQDESPSHATDQPSTSHPRNAK